MIVAVPVSVTVFMTMSMLVTFVLVPVMAAMALPTITLATPPAMLVSTVAAHDVGIAQVGPVDIEADVHAADLYIALQCGGQTDTSLPTVATEPKPHPCVRRVIDLG